ncbi:flagellar hook-associated protein FlgK [Microbacterium esteraromaticum]|uniref:flagellar hook-associated protein FlgK n=1 Tax=Microbacterium esteraromaticum TaxID=57043 RepID=UPI00195881F7|nr:flagellar hook-associated protein FlgK [Microbacterium esteraromaticum]MBM7466793.1 flagellar hook-associated protein 1 FlgK [Microbacterium esteraromaticum]
MSTFSGLGTAASALAAARRGMDVVGQNIANQATDGYTRQRVSTSAIAAVAQSGRFSLGALPGHGVSVDGVARLGDVLLDARVRDTAGAAGFWSARALAATTAETALAEPTEHGLAARLSQFWNAWQDLGNTPDQGAAAATVLQSASELATRIAGGYRAVATQWADARQSAERTVAQLNTAASQIAQLNTEIRDALGAGSSANELIDRRDALVQTTARLAGARGTLEADGTMTVRIDGNALVAGGDARSLTLAGPVTIEQGGALSVSWSGADGFAVSVDGGELGGLLSVLAPADDGGTLARLAGSYDDVARALASSVNERHRAGVTAAGQTGGDFFALSGSGPAALGLSVAVGSASDLAVAKPGGGPLDSSNADAISQIGRSAGGPDSIWADVVAGFAVATAGDIQRATLSDVASTAAVGAQRSVAGVDGDEETISLLTFQTAYQAAARVLTAVDESLDVLINRTGLVGR